MLIHKFICNHCGTNRDSRKNKLPDGWKEVGGRAGLRHFCTEDCHNLWRDARAAVSSIKRGLHRFKFGYQCGVFEVRDAYLKGTQVRVYVIGPFPEVLENGRAVLKNCQGEMTGKEFKAGLGVLDSLEWTQKSNGDTPGEDPVFGMRGKYDFKVGELQGYFLIEEVYKQDGQICFLVRGIFPFQNGDGGMHLKALGSRIVTDSELRQGLSALDKVSGNGKWFNLREPEESTPARSRLKAR